MNIRVRLLSLFLTISALSGCGMAGLPFTGQVTDAETGEPIEGVIVVALWRGDINPIIDSSQVCYHVESAVSDESGNYRIPGWVGGKFGVMGSFVVLEVYKKDYRKVKEINYNDGSIGMEVFSGAPESRMKYLASFAGKISCGTRKNRREELFSLYKTIYSEASGLSNTNSYMSYMDSIRYRIVTNLQKSENSMTRKEANDYFERELRGEFQ